MEENKTMELERWFSLEEISKHLGVSKDTIRGWIKRDTIPYWIESGQSADADKITFVLWEAEHG